MSLCVVRDTDYYLCYFCWFFLFEVYGDHRDLHVFTHAFPTLRSSDLHKRASCLVRHVEPFMEIESDRVALLETITHVARSEEHTSELQSLMRISYAVFCLKNKSMVQVIAVLLTQGCQY